LRMRRIRSQVMLREIKFDSETTHAAKNLNPSGKNRRL
jgi:hypothetical protein